MAIGRRIEFDPEEEEVESRPIIGRKIDFTQPQLSRLRSLLSAFPKGFLKGHGGEALLPRTGPIPQKLGERVTEQFLPTQKRAPENILERAGKIARSTIGGGGGLFGTAARSLIGGALGEGIKEAGGGETAQTVGEIAAFGLPGLGRKLVPTKAQEKLVEHARKAGMTEKQIAPLLPGKGKKAFFGKIASKGEKTQRAMQSTKEGTGGVYEFVKESPDAAQMIRGPAAEKFLRDSAKIAEDIPREVRKQVFDDALDLLKEGGSGRGLINFYQDLSSRYKVGREQLERLKKPIIEALEAIEPGLGEDFKLTNELYKRGIGIRKTLKPGLSSELMDLGELGKLVHSISKLSMKGMGELLGIAGARRFAREMLINPRLQNITKQMQKAVEQHKFPIAIELADYINNRYKEED